MQRINIKGTVNQKNIISGVVHRGGGEGDERDHFFGVPVNPIIWAQTEIYEYEKNEIPIEELIR